MSNFGTLAYMTPEIIDGNKFSVKSDVYTFGILMNLKMFALTFMNSLFMMGILEEFA